MSHFSDEKKGHRKTYCGSDEKRMHMNIICIDFMQLGPLMDTFDVKGQTKPHINTSGPFSAKNQIVSFGSSSRFFLFYCVIRLTSKRAHTLNVVRLSW